MSTGARGSGAGATDERRAATQEPSVGSIDVIETNGQSWATIDSYRPEEADHEDRTGASAASLRAADDEGVLVAYTPNRGTTAEFRKPALSDGRPISSLRPFRIRDGFSLGTIAAVARARLRRRWSLTQRPCVAARFGWPGTSWEYFLPAHAGGLTRDDLPELLWDRDVRSRAEIDAAALSLTGVRPAWSSIFWAHGVTSVDSEYSEFLSARRHEIDQLPQGRRHVFGDQGHSAAAYPVTHSGALGQLRFHQDNRSGMDWLVGPRYPYRLRDLIHHTALGTALLGEMYALAEVTVARTGSWEPFWVRERDVAPKGRSTIAIRTSRPSHALGDIWSTTSPSPIADLGFVVRDGGGRKVPIADISLGWDTIELTMAERLSGTFVVSYAMEGARQPEGTVERPTHVGAWGNVRVMTSVERPILPGVYEHALCNFRHAVSA